ncbi:MAG: hypothetical protein BGP12_11925 [Rhodospirillales bacterium 70-18]|nr:hypothetical protein [Rhodospirillales bacterium]OJY72251.1 MAG: hypothetical protein BGP12_11925 [Rhodospirillales bacterium 70-18]
MNAHQNGGRQDWEFFGDHAVSAAPFADNLPGLARAPRDEGARTHPDAPLLTPREAAWACAAILATTVVALAAGA